MQEYKGRSFNDGNDFLYNKINYLEEQTQYADVTKRAYFDIFHKFINYVEVNKNKDLYDFSIEEIKKLVKNAPTTSVRTKSTIFSAINGYCRWANNRGFCYTGNPCDSITNLRELVSIGANTMKNTYIKLEDFYTYVFDMKNVCSMVELSILVLARYGVKANELENIKFEDIDKESKILYIKDKQLPIDDRFISFMNEVKECHDFEFNNNTRQHTIYIDNGYIMKPTSKTRGGKIKSASIYNRHDIIYKKTGENKISLATLNKNRKFDMLFNKIKNNILTYKDYEDVNSIFGDNTETGNYSLKTDFDIITDNKIKTIKE